MTPRSWDEEGELVGDYATSEPAAIDVEVNDPEVLGYLLGPDGEPIATLLSRRRIPFGFQGS